MSYGTATGNRTGVTVHATSAGGSEVTAAYTYPAAGATRPHTVTAVGGTAVTGAGSYGYDADGDTTSAPGQSLTYDQAGRLATVTTSAGTQQDVYDASGRLLLQVDPTQGASLFLGDTVLHQSGSGPVSGVRTFTSNGGVPVAERTATAGVSGSTLTWLFTDVDGTVDVQTVAATGVTTDLYRDPFGVGVAGSTGVWGDGNGYLNKPATTDTGLTSLGDRFYDATLGRFVTADPLLAPGNPQQVNGYSYAANNPITNTDPTGDCYNASADGSNDVLTHNVNCAGGHGANAPGAATIQAQKQAITAMIARADSFGSSGSASGSHQQSAKSWGDTAWDTFVQAEGGHEAQREQASIAAGFYTTDLYIQIAVMVPVGFCNETELAEACDSTDEAINEDLAETEQQVESGLKTESADAGSSLLDDVSKVESHLKRLDYSPANDAMLARIRNAANDGRDLTDGERNFITHETTEARLMDGGMGYDQAHEIAGQTHPTFGNYDPDVIKQYPELFNRNWRNYLGIE